MTAARTEERDDLSLRDGQSGAEQRLRLAIKRLDAPDFKHQATFPSAERATQSFAFNSSGVPSAMTCPQ